MRYKCATFEVPYEFELVEDITIPSGCVLKFEGGKITGAHTLTGQNTQIKAEDDVIFDNGITIAGTWNCSRITSAWLGDATSDDRIRQIFNLQNENIENKIIVEAGDYYVTATTDLEVCITLSKDTELCLIGNIKLRASDQGRYGIVGISDNSDNVTICGSGSIIGDKNIHTGSSGEWGNCISIGAANNVVIKGISIKDSWGDGVYSTGCINLSIIGCTIDGARRNGISIIAGKNITIKGNTIKNVNGTAPKAAIDFEPNTRDQIIENAWITGNIITDCFIGIELVAARSWIKNAIIDNNVMSTTLSGETHAISLYGYKNPSGAQEYPNEIKRCENIEVCRNKVDGFFRSFSSGYGQQLFFHDNVFTLDKDISSMVTETAKNEFYICDDLNFSRNRYMSPLQIHVSDGSGMCFSDNLIDTYTYRYNYTYGMGLDIYASSTNGNVFVVQNNTIDGGINIGFTGLVVGNMISHFLGDGVASVRGYNGRGFIFKGNSFFEEQDRPIIALYGDYATIEGNRFYGAEGRTSSYIRLMSASNHCKVGAVNYYSVAVATPVSNEGTDNIVETF